ncbi:uncharacterized protein LOC117117059 [Anneissia japonica]|uniref:uncharacterized protein LOC117117059 n=1 Tax=Anneissia japonica TaxID=1529436 RepID=UPI00142599D4|nr:uncharacterized protein LOC117117059 [Anneissia japonica]
MQLIAWKCTLALCFVAAYYAVCVAGSDGYYIYLNSISGTQYRYAFLNIQTIPATWSDLCLNFYYYISGDSSQLIVIKDNYHSYDLFEIFGDYSSQWKYASLYLTNHPSSLYLELNGRVLDATEMVAVDNIYITEGICLKNEGGNCSDFEYNWCGWTNYYSSSYLWTRSSGSIGIGQDGYYIYVQSSSGSRDGYLRSPKIQATWGEFCLTFYYYASDVNQYLRIYQDNSNSFWTVFFVRGDSSVQWEYVSLQLINRYNYELRLRGYASYGTIAVDNICIIEGLCVENNETTALTCPSNVTVGTDTGAATASINYSSAIFTNCGNNSVISPDPTQIFPAHLDIGTKKFTFTAIESTRNSDTCTFTITVEDTEKPTLKCPLNETVDTDEGSATASVDYSSKINATDNSGNITTISPDPCATFPTELGIGEHKYNFTVADSSGNTDNCLFTITVQDIEKPTLKCPPNETIDTDDGKATASVDYSSKINATDNSGNITTISPDPCATFPTELGIGEHKYNFTVADSSGNTDNCLFAITVQDIEKPTLKCPPNETIDTDDGKATASVDYSSKINASDNSGDIPTISPLLNETFPVDIGIGAHVMFAFAANDSSGNTDTCTFTINVQDTEKPTINCPPDETIDTDEGSATALVDYSSKINATDNSGNITTISPNPNETFPVDLGIGPHKFPFTATDSSGNYDNCTFNITVQDTEKPTVNCPPDKTIDTDEGSATTSVDYSSKIYATDNSGDIPTISPKPNETFPVDLRIGPHKFTFTATDSSGNYDNCTFTIQVLLTFNETEVSGVALSSDPDSVTLSASVDADAKNGPFKISANQTLLDESISLQTSGEELSSASDIVSIDIYDKNNEIIQVKSIEINFPVIKVNSTENGTSASLSPVPVCYYTQDENVISAKWSMKGCKTVYENYVKNGVTCVCDHLTSFVILMKPKPVPTNENDILSLLTTVGLSISSLFLIITLVIICIFRDLRNSERYKIMRHLVIALLCVNCFFLLLEVDAKESILCSVLAASLHYSLLAAFSWMLIISTDLFMKIKHPFADHSKRFTYSRFIGWIGPVIVVGPTAGIARGNYVSDECWLNAKSGSIWTFIFPVYISNLVVLVQLIVIGYVAFKKSQLPSQTEEEMQTLKRIRNMFLDTKF